MSSVSRYGNKVTISGVLNSEGFRNCLATVHQAVTSKGYQDIVLDFSNCTAAFPVAMLPICAQALLLRQQNIDFSLVLPEKDEKLTRLFVNANWANLIDPNNYEPSSYRGYLQIPATQFENSLQQYDLVNRVIESILRSTPDLVREDLAAIEWAFNEITDNVLNHANSPVGGLIQFSTRTDTKKIEFAVCDAGIGIPASLMPSHPEIPDSLEALAWAVKEGVTRDKEIGQGNGLFGGSQICRESKGFFSLHSELGEYWTNSSDSFKLRRFPIPWHGTVVDVCISFAVPNVLERALKFGGQVYRPQVDYIESKYELGEREGVVLFSLIDEAESMGTRSAGRPLRMKLLNLINLSDCKRVVVDFSGISMVSSSFADEVFGKLFLELKPGSGKVEFINMNQKVKWIVDKAIRQRMEVHSAR